MTSGPEPIRYITDDGAAATLPVPNIDAVDTMGAGDIFHGAFCHFVLEQDFAQAMTSAARIASQSCTFFGTRAWIEHYPS
jgi:sugar/nucleoside kinase (ribokinase family)